MIVTVTGLPGIVTAADLPLIKDGAILMNGGHFPHEIDVAALPPASPMWCAIDRYEADDIETLHLKDGRSLPYSRRRPYGQPRRAAPARQFRGDRWISASRCRRAAWSVVAKREVGAESLHRAGAGGYRCDGGKRLSRSGAPPRSRRTMVPIILTRQPRCGHAPRSRQYQPADRAPPRSNPAILRRVGPGRR